ncbi:hypothetical protein SESBI_12501 [Sesbania bispinosa]|nr:hypothetical protein SESBI_12501 [Sesbania bispinosa]
MLPSPKACEEPELAREFLLDAATVIFKEQVAKAFREGTARQNAHSIFVCLALKLLEERVHVACNEIITLEKQEKGKTKRKGEKQRKKCSESIDVPGSPEVSKEESSAPADTEQDSAIRCRSSVIATDEANLPQGDYPNIQDEDFSSDCSPLRTQDCPYDDYDGDNTNSHDRNGTSKVEQSKFYRQRLRYRKDFQLDMSSKWSDRRNNAVVSENGVMVGRSEPRHHVDNFGTSMRGINGLNRQSKINVPKSSGRNVGHKCNEKFYSSNCRMSDRYDFHSCSCSLNNKMTRLTREMKPASKSESAVDTSKQFYRGSKYNQVDSMHESYGRPKSKVISGNYPSRDLLQAKKVWEPMESYNKHARSNSDPDVTLRSTGQGFQFDLVRSPVDEVGDSGEIDDEDSDLKRSGIAEGCQNDLDAEAEGSCSSTEIASEEPVICVMSSTLNNSSDPSQGSTSSSDNFSSCLSEGDNNTTSSNRENTESSTSDSEDASQKSEGRDSSTCIDNGLSGCHEAGIEKTHNANGEGLTSKSLSGPSLDVAGSDAFRNSMVEIAQNFENGFSSTNVCSQPQSMLPPMPNQSIQFPVYQTPSAMGYYHQNPVSWPAAPTNGLVPFLHPNHYLYAGPLGYSLNEDPRFCLQYGALQQPTPLFNPTAFPVYQQLSRANGLNAEELTQISKPASMQEHFDGSIAERVVPAAANSKKAELNGEDGHALSTGSKTATASLNGDNVGDFNSKSSADQIEKDRGCNKKETAIIEEYNLFASNSLRFSIL